MIQNPGHQDIRHIRMFGLEKFAKRLKGRRYSDVRFKKDGWKFRFCREYNIKCSRIGLLKADTGVQICRSMMEMAQAACFCAGITLEDLKAKTRKKHLGEARRGFCRAAYKAGYSQQQIADFLGKDRSTVAHHLKAKDE